MISIPKSVAFNASVKLFNNSVWAAAPVANSKVINILVQKPDEEKFRVSKSASVSIFGKKAQARLLHTEVSVPSFDDYRKKENIKSDARNEGFHGGRIFTYVIAGGGALGAINLGSQMGPGYLTYLAPAKDVLAMAKIEVNLSQIPEGKNMVFKWRGKPLFIRHRTATEIETEQNVNMAELRDPQQDADRFTDPKWLVVLGVCTHLGCVPVSNAGEYGGYYCPCHGSHYDTSGRIRKGPAPLNLEVPPHEFLDDTTLVVG